MTTRLGCLLLSLSVALAGCTHPSPRLKPPAVGLRKPIPGGNQRQIILVTPFADRRDTSRCGILKNARNEELADAVCVGNPVEWIGAFFAKELKASGFTLLPSEDGARDSAIKIEGFVLKFFAEPVVRLGSATIETDLSVRLVVTSKTGLQAERTFFVKGDEDAYWISQGFFNESIENGLRQLLAKMVNAVLELVNRYPQVGGPPVPWRRVGATLDARHR